MAVQLEQRNGRQQECINDRAFDQHGCREQKKDADLIAQLPFVLMSDPLPDKQADEKNDKGQRHVGAHECGQSRAQQIQSKCAKSNYRGRFTIRVPGGSK